jgi:hypothetical protein
MDHVYSFSHMSSHNKAIHRTICNMKLCTTAQPGFVTGRYFIQPNRIFSVTIFFHSISTTQSCTHSSDLSLTELFTSRKAFLFSLLAHIPFSPIITNFSTTPLNSLPFTQLYSCSRHRVRHLQSLMNICVLRFSVLIHTTCSQS